MTKKVAKKKSKAGRPADPNKKVHIGLRASQLGIDNCKDIAEKTGQSFSSVVSKAMEEYRGV